MTPFAVVHSAAGTFHFAAAALLSISRAAAPASRTYWFDERTPWLPPVDIEPHTLLRRKCSFGSAYSAVTFAQSHSSSSATSCASAVKVPCPISVRAMRMVTASSGWMSSHAVTSGAFAPGFANAAPGSVSSSISPPPASAETFRKSRRESAFICHLPRPSGWPRARARRCRSGRGSSSLRRCPRPSGEASTRAARPPRAACRPGSSRTAGPGGRPTPAGSCAGPSSRGLRWW